MYEITVQDDLGMHTYYFQTNKEVDAFTTALDEWANHVSYFEEYVDTNTEELQDA